MVFRNIPVIVAQEAGRNKWEFGMMRHLRAFRCPASEKNTRKQFHTAPGCDYIICLVTDVLSVLAFHRR